MIQSGKCLVSGPANLWVQPDRIPVMCATSNGTLLAFAENRIVVTNDDGGYINCTLRRSADGGATWTSRQTIATDGNNTFSCGAAVVDATTGMIFFFSGWSLFGDSEATIDNGTAKDTKHMFVLSSPDNGASWTAPVDISTSIKRAGWRWCDPGPASGLQLASGRLIVPFYYSTAAGYYPSVMYSDDHGNTWQSSYGATNNVAGYNECSVVQQGNGTLLMIARNGTTNPGNIGIATSSDSGVTWTAMTNSATLSDSGCEACAIRYTMPSAYGKSRLLFSNPPNATPGARSNVCVRVSYDEGNTWTVSKQYFAGPSGYSALAILTNGNWAILAENGVSTYCDQISFISDTLSNLTSGGDTLNPPTNPPPTLNITSTASNILITWPVTDATVYLQQNTDLSRDTWINTTGSDAVQTTNGLNQLMLPPTNPSLFFRLVSP